MGWQDRPYYRDRNSGSTNPLMWLVNGSLPLGVWFGIDVRMHAMMVVFMVWTLIVPGQLGWHNAVTSMAILFGVVLLHEFGHCFGSRMVGGNPTQILMHPLGGLAFADPPHRPWPNFVTVIAGPMVNVLICLLAGSLLGIVAGSWQAVPWNPFRFVQTYTTRSPMASYYLWWIFKVSEAILLFNLWPVFPLDGGQMLQSILWAKFGYYKATIFATVTGMVGASIFGVLGLSWGAWFIVFLAIWGFMHCLNKHRELKANGPWAYQDDGDFGGGSFAASRRSNARSLKRAQKIQREELEEQQQIDAILAKVSATGMRSLTWWEKRALRKATEHQRQRDSELTKSRKY